LSSLRVIGRERGVVFVLKEWSTQGGTDVKINVRLETRKASIIVRKVAER